MTWTDVMSRSATSLPFIVIRISLSFLHQGQWIFWWIEKSLSSGFSSVSPQSDMCSHSMSSVAISNDLRQNAQVVLTITCLPIICYSVLKLGFSITYIKSYCKYKLFFWYMQVSLSLYVRPYFQSVMSRLKIIFSILRWFSWFQAMPQRFFLPPSTGWFRWESLLCSLCHFFHVIRLFPEQVQLLPENGFLSIIFLCFPYPFPIGYQAVTVPVIWCVNNQ